MISKEVWPMSSYNNTRSLGYLIKAFIELFDISNEDGLRGGFIWRYDNGSN